MNNERDGRKLQIEIVLYVKFPTWESDAHDPTKKKSKPLEFLSELQWWSQGYIFGGYIILFYFSYVYEM